MGVGGLAPELSHKETDRCSSLFTLQSLFVSPFRGTTALEGATQLSFSYHAARDVLMASNFDAFRRRTFDDSVANLSRWAKSA